MTIPQALERAVQFHQAGRLAEAEALYRQILAAQPQHFDALHLLGVIAHQVGRSDLAVEWIRQAIVQVPNNPVAHSNLGEAFRASGRLDEAVAAYGRALELKPDYPDARYNLGVALEQMGRPDDAADAYRRTLEFEPNFVKAHNNLGNVLQERGQFGEAVIAYRRALELEPHQPEARNNLGNALRHMGQFDEAMAAYRRALEFKPNFTQAHNNLGNALQEQGRLDEAIAAYRRALELEPDNPGTHNNLGNALRRAGQLGEALAAYRRALELKPDFQKACGNLGSAQKDVGQLDEAILSYRRALQLRNDDPSLHSNLVYTLLFHPASDRRAIAEEHQRWSRQFAEPLKRFIRPHSNDRNLDRRLRIGYVSPDFRDHVVGRYLMPLFQHHDHRDFEILCYSGVEQPDRLTDEFRRRADQWRATIGVSDEALAEMIRQDGVDILVDLTQHMAGNRLPMFARKPAPVQVSFAGYPASAGLEAIEYRISDRYLEAGNAVAGLSEAGPDSMQKSSESTEHLCFVDSFWCYDPCGADVPVSDLPAGKSGRVNFGCLNNFCKVNDPVLRLWARILRKVENSRVMLASPAGAHRQRTLDVLQSEGIDAHRVEFVGRCSRREYLELYHRLDIVLDPFPYNGGVTSCEALWMGVPVVSLIGDMPMGRAGLSLLSNLGLPELAAHSEDEYVGIAESLASDLPRLARLRASLRDRMEKSVLMDAPRFAGQVEESYRFMWKRWLGQL